MSSSLPLTAPRPERFALLREGRWPSVLGALALISMLAFEAIAVAAAMPHIASALQGLDLYAFAFGGLVATSVLGMVVGGQVCDRRGAATATAVGLAVFVLGLLVAALAPTMPLLVVGRVVQGLGSGVLQVALYVGMAQLVPAALHPTLFAGFAGAWVLPALVGPTVAAVLTERIGWPAVFWSVAALAPLAGAALLPPLRRLPRPERDEAAWGAREHRQLAWGGLAALGALALHGATGPWPAGVQSLALSGGLLMAVLACTRLLPAGTLRAAWGLPSVVALRGLIAAAFLSAEAFIPLLLTHTHGWSLAQAGVALSVGAVCWSIGSALQARLVREAWRERGLRWGFVLVALGIAAGAPTLVLQAPAWTLVLGWAVAGVGVGLSFPMLSVLTLRYSAPGEEGKNASALQLSDALATTLALAAAGWSLRLTPNLSAALGAVLAASVAMALMGAALAGRARR